jgi:hypothetical protein
LRHNATSRKIAGSIPNEVIGFSIAPRTSKPTKISSNCQLHDAMKSVVDKDAIKNGLVMMMGARGSVVG